MIKVTQICDGCDKERTLAVSLDDRLRMASLLDGWRQVRANKHLCPECIQKALGDR